MQDMRWSLFTRLFVVPLTLLALFSACSYKWTDLRPPFERTIPAAEPEYARVGLKNGPSVELEAPIVERDTLFGDVPLLTADQAPYFSVTMVARGDESVARAAIPIGDIRRFEARKGDAARNALSGVAVLLGAALLVAVVATFALLSEWGADSP